MHPVFRLIPGVFFGALCGLLAAGAGFAQQDLPRAQVTVAPSVQTYMAPTMDVPGTVISKNDARLAAEVPGAIAWIAEVGSVVSQGDVIVRIDDYRLRAQLTQAEAEVARLEADLEFRGQEVERIEELARTNNTPIRSLEQARSTRDMIRQDLIQAQASLDLARENMDRATVQAPFPGRVVERLSQLGEYATIGRELVRLVDTEHLEVRAQAPVTASRFLDDDLEVRIAGDNAALSSSIRSVIPVADEASRMMEIRIGLEPGTWAIGTAVTVSLPSAPGGNVVAVPRDALIIRTEGTHLFRIADGGLAERIDVTTGMSSGDLVEVRGNIGPGERVVIRGGERLQDGQPVLISEQDS